MKTFLLFLFFGVAVLGFFIEPTRAQADPNCPNGEDYSPCFCYDDGSVNCPALLLPSIADVFQRTTPANLTDFIIYLNEITLTISTDFLSNHQVNRQIDFRCQNTRLRLDPDAFRSSKTTVTSIIFDGCDLSRLDFDFLSGFEKLSELNFNHVVNVGKANWASFPSPLPRLSSLIIEKSEGLNEWYTFPQLSHGLAEIWLGFNDIGDVGLDGILNWTLKYSTDTLADLDLRSNDITRFPWQLQDTSYLPNLAYVPLSSQKSGIPIIQTRSLYVNSSPYYLSLEDNKIVEIQEGAFQGDYRNVTININSNLLTRFEESVFKQMLSQMVGTADGNLLVGGNPFDCERDPCHLAWLIRDNRNLLDAGPLYASCSNSTYFKDLDPNGFTDCP